MFSHIPSYGGDPIFRLAEAFHADPREQKINLTIGLYYDDAGHVPILDMVQEAEADWAARRMPRTYLSMEGFAPYREAVQKLVFGPASAALAQGRVATIQTLGGSGALSVGAAFLHDTYPNSEISISDPAWDNHHAIFGAAGVKTHTYTYYDPATKGLAFDAMLAEISALPRHSIVLLHPCCHNPTGVDLSEPQWQQLIPVLVEKELIPFVDMAYQGFGRGLDEDAYAIRAMVDAGLSFFVANSFSKNFSYYSERCGALSVVCQSSQEAERVLGQFKAIVRRTYSNPPAHGAQAIAQVLNTPALFARWEHAVGQMRERIAECREQVHQRLQARLPAYDSSYFVKQQGMFCYTGLSATQLQALRSEHGVYILDSGRISMPGLNSRNIDAFVDALVAVLS